MFEVLLITLGPVFAAASVVAWVSGRSARRERDARLRARPQATIATTAQSPRRRDRAAVVSSAR